MTQEQRDEVRAHLNETAELFNSTLRLLSSVMEEFARAPEFDRSESFRIRHLGFARNCLQDACHAFQDVLAVRDNQREDETI